MKGQQRIDTKLAKLERNQEELAATINVTPRPSRDPNRGQGTSRPSAQQRDAKSRDRRWTVWDQDGKPRCFRCGQFGHYVRDCGQARKPKPGTSQPGNA